MGLIRWFILALFVLFVVSKMGFAREVNGTVTGVLLINVSNESISLRSRDGSTDLIFPNRPGFVSDGRFIIRQFQEEIPVSETNCTFLEEVVKTQFAQTRGIILESVDNVGKKIDGNINVTCPVIECPTFGTEEVQECRSRLNATDLSLNACLQSNLLKDGQCRILEGQLQYKDYAIYLFAAIFVAILFIIYKDDIIRKGSAGGFI